MNKQELRTNKQELISKYELLKNGYNFNVVAIDGIISDLKRLDEPEKVVVPQKVAEYIEQMKNEGYHLLGAMTEIRSHKNKEIDDWFYTDDNMELFARAWLDGYEAEKEKQYAVVMKETKQPLYYNAVDKELFFSMGGLATNFTRKQLEEAGFGWVFDCPGIEIEEV